MQETAGCLICTDCATEYPLDQPRWRCRCGGALDIRSGVGLGSNLSSLSESTLWRYRQSIPVRNVSNIVSLGEGMTPIIPVRVGTRSVLVKQEQLMPTGSFKDRGASVLVSKAKELGIKRVILDSSGNAGCAVAAYCARAGIQCKVFVPADTNPAKLIQITAYGAKVVKIRGSREDTAAAALEAARRTYYASHYWNPFFFQGTKTLAFEVWEQLGGRAPDALVLPVGNGTLVLGAYIGFSELHRDRLIKRLPKIVAVQVRNCAPLVKAFHENFQIIPVVKKKMTLAEGIAINAPIRGRQIIQAVHSTGGTFLAVTEEEISAALRAMLRQGFYIEPTAAVAIAGTTRYLPTARTGETIVTVFTGHGLKSAK